MLAVLSLTALVANSPSIAQASAEDVLADARACAVIATPQARLECFDMMVGKHSLAASPTQRPTSPGRWDTNESRSPVDDSRSLTAFVRAHSVSGGGMAIGEPTAELAIRCRERKLDVLLLSNSYFGTSGNDRAVLVRIGQQTARQERWSPSDTGQAIGIWGGTRATAFVRELADTEASALVIRADTFRSQITAQFDITGAKQALEPLLTLCAAPPRAPAPTQPRR